ncbi:hypothetical protein ACLK17_06435 [Escherichia coli]
MDMQNAYATHAATHLAGFDVSTTRPSCSIQTAVTPARAAGMLIIWFQNGGDDSMSRLATRLTQFS